MVSVWLLMAGLAGGFIAGLLGVGGGIIFLVALPFALLDFGISENDLVQFIVANSLFGVFFASLAGNITHISTKTFHLREIVYVAISGSITAILILLYVVVQPWYTRWIFNIVIILFLLYIFFIRWLSSTENKEISVNKNYKPFNLSLAGVAGGTLSALSGTGGGAITVPILYHWLHINIKKAKSISLGMILLSSMVMTISNLLQANVNIYSTMQQGLILFPVVLPLTAGVIVSAPIGVKTSHRLSSNRISSIFALLIIVVIVEKLVELYQLFLA